MSHADYHKVHLKGNSNSSGGTEFYTQFTEFSTHPPPQEFIRLDVLWGVILAFMSVIGTTGNILSVIYFCRKRKKTIHDILYKIMSILDTVSSLLSWPVIVVLFSTRRQVLFESVSFCGLWTCLFQATNVIAQFLVMVISVSRTVSVIAPFHKIREQMIISAIGLYATAELVFYAGLFWTGVIKFVYYIDMGYCSTVPKSFKKVPLREELWDHVFVPMQNLKTLGPMIITFFSFIISVLVLVTRKTNGTVGRKEAKIRKVTVTITMFTAIYLSCQLPLLITKMMSHSIKWFEGTTDFFAYEAYMGWNYSLFFQVMFPVLNCTLNPLLYYCRMPKYKSWMKTAIRSSVATERNRAVVSAILGGLSAIRQGLPTRKSKEDVVRNNMMYDYAKFPEVKGNDNDYLDKTIGTHVPV